MKKYIFSLLVISIGTLIYNTLSESNAVISNASGPPAGKTGSIGDGGSTCNGCHSGSVTPVTGWISSDIPSAGYIAGDTYTITLTAFGTTEVKFGFQATSEKLSDNSKTGTPIITNGTETQIVGTDYVEHTTAGTTGSTGSHTWSYDWIAPTTGTGDIAFYAAFNVSNNNASAAGDMIYISSLQMPELILENVFVNELHYDNNSTDSLEGIEIAGEAGIDLSCYELVLYNGHDSTVYNTVPLSGTIPNQSCGYGTVWFPMPPNGIQNGPADGFALYDICNMAILQFLSYEGTITAVDGPAQGMASTDIGIDESSSTNGGFSLQLQGSGTTYNDFTWSGPDSNTYGMVNAAQYFGTIAITTSSDTAFCDGGSASISANVSGGSPPFTYIWNSLGNTSSHTVSPSVTTSYSVYGLDSLNCMSSKDTITITVWPKPTITTSIDTTVCEGATININGIANNGTPPYTYNWNNGLPDSSSHAVSPASNTTYSVYGIDSAGCTTTMDSIQVGITPSPVIDLSAMVIDSSTCGNNDGSITGITTTMGTSPYSFEWVDDNANIIGSSIDLLNAAAGSYTLTVIDMVYGCSSSTGILAIADAGAPSIMASPDTAICEGDSATITAIATGGILPYTYFWSNSLPDTNSNVVSPLQTTTYSVLVTDNAGCQSGMDSVNVKVNALPLPGFTSAINGLNVVITNTSTGSASYQWDFGDGNTGTDTNPIHNYSADGSYTVCLTAISSDGCVASLCKTIVVSATGISQVNPLGLKVYPNPSKTGVFNMLLYNSMVTEQPTISIYNTSGELLMNRGFSTAGQNYLIDLSNQPNGIYYIRVSGSKTVINKKITIIR